MIYVSQRNHSKAPNLDSLVVICKVVWVQSESLSEENCTDPAALPDYFFLGQQEWWNEPSNSGC